MVPCAKPTDIRELRRNSADRVRDVYGIGLIYVPGLILIGAMLSAGFWWSVLILDWVVAVGIVPVVR